MDYIGTGTFGKNNDTRCTFCNLLIGKHVIKDKGIKNEENLRDFDEGVRKPSKARARSLKAGISCLFDDFRMKSGFDI
ncbi:hypothetical protein PA598K_02366 [Paenibacillus sp. 598K]|nr:hypothetical protein PA598K_02366 [Paenibacillus sp. 598K]